MVVLAEGLSELILRIALGILLIGHGWPKLKNFSNTAGWLASTGFKPGKFWALVLILTEFFGGLGLIVGLLTRFIAAALILEFLVILYLKIFKWKKQFASGDSEWDYDMLILAAAIALFLLGAGSISIDSMIGWNLG
jgi:putative oxidoreductase